MIVCSCHVVSDRKLRELADEHCADEVVRLTGAGTACGGCQDAVARLLADAGPCRPDSPCARCPKRRSSAA